MEFAKNLNIYLYRELTSPTRAKVVAGAIGEMASNGCPKRGLLIRNTPDVLHCSVTRGFTPTNGDAHEIAGLSQLQAFDFIQMLMEAGQTLQSVQLLMKIQASCYKSPRPGRSWVSLITDHKDSRDFLSEERTIALAGAKAINPEIVGSKMHFMPHIRLGDSRNTDMIYEGQLSPYVLGQVKGHITEPGSDLSIAGTLPALSQCLFAMETY